MRFFNEKSYKDMSRRAAQIVSAQVLLRPASVLGLATGATPVGLYKSLVELVEEGALDLSEVHTINLDEYVGLSSDHPQSYRAYMGKHLFGKAQIPKENTHLPDGMVQDEEEECQRYDKLIEELGGIDLQVLGIGSNGHIGFNEPDDVFHLPTRRVTLHPSTRKRNSVHFPSGEEVPRYAITVGIRTIMHAKRILLIADREKREILERALFGPVTPEVPASILQLHPDVDIVMVRD